MLICAKASDQRMLQRDDQALRFIEKSLVDTYKICGLLLTPCKVGFAKLFLWSLLGAMAFHFHNRNKFMLLVQYLYLQSSS